MEIPSDEFTRKFIACSVSGRSEVTSRKLPSFITEVLPYKARLPPSYAARALQRLAVTPAFAEADEDTQEQLFQLLSYFTAPCGLSSCFSYHFVHGCLLRPIPIRTDDDALNVLVKDGCTGFRVWEAAKFLLSFLLKNPEILQGKRVLELGAGTGFVGLGLAISDLCPEVVMSDVHDGVLARIEESIVESQCGEVAKVAKLDWQNFSAEHFRTSDIIIGADVVYDVSLVPPLVDCLDALLRDRHDRVALILCAVRIESTTAAFCKEMTERGLTWKEVIRTSVTDPSILINSLIYGNEVECEVILFEIYRDRWTLLCLLKIDKASKS